METNTSNIFVQNRVIGYVCNEVPLSLRYIKRRKENLAVTCVGKAFHTWGCNRLLLLSVSPQHDAEIECLASDRFLVFTATRDGVFAWRRGVELKHRYENSSKTTVLHLLPFGPHLLGLDGANVLTVWDIASEEVFAELDFPLDTFRVTSMCHPATYINKILFGSEQGKLQLWNINRTTLIYEFKGWGSPVTALCQSPALHVIAVGLDNGSIVMHNFGTDETLFEFRQDAGRVTNLAFRTDGKGILASGAPNGHVVFWDLDERKVDSELKAHSGPISGLEFLPCEPALITSSADNSLKMWTFDKPDGSGRQLRIRNGHEKPPTYVRFYGQTGTYVLSAGADRYLKAFNVVTEIANKNLGRAGYKPILKRKLDEHKVEDMLFLPEIMQFAAETTREKEWANIAAVHRGSGIFSTWSFNRCCMNAIVRNSQLHTAVRRFGGTRSAIVATCVCITKCGNFVLIGYNSGRVDKFNIQSSILRGSFGSPAHAQRVTGVAVNNVNCIVITASIDRNIKFWSLRSNQYLSNLDVGEAISGLQAHTESSMVAVALENFEVAIVDTDTRTIVRRQAWHRDQITDLTFSPDSRWLLSASMDGTIRTWDLPSDKCVDIIQVDAPCTSITFSPTGAYIATAHVDCLGIKLWANRHIFSFVPLYEKEAELTASLCDQFTHLDLVSTSGIGRWQTIAQIDMIRGRNKAKAIEEPPEAPFFLPTTASVNARFDVDAELPATKARPAFNLRRYTAFGRTLNEEAYEEALEQIVAMSPSAVNMEITSLAPDHGGSDELMVRFANMLQRAFNQSQRFELIASYLAVFLKTHTQYLLRPECSVYVKPLSEAHNNAWSRLERRFAYSISVSKFLRDF